MSIIRTIYLKKNLRRLAAGIFKLFQKFGISIVPNHYYTPIPDVDKLDNGIWNKRSELPGVNINLKRMLELLSEFRQNYQSEYDAIPFNNPHIPGKYYYSCPDFGPVDGHALYCMIRKFKPKRIIEIGSGFSTLSTAQAVTVNKEKDSVNCEFIAIEPYPRDMLIKGLPGLSGFIQSEVQKVDIKEFAKLQENDILFIDSSHVLKTGGDVQYEYLEILPRLNKGVIIHIHDIFLPVEYPQVWLKEMLRFWNEQYLLQAFLAFNDSFEVLWGGSMMHLNYPEELEKAFKYYNPKSNHPGSFWIRKIR